APHPPRDPLEQRGAARPRVAPEEDPRGLRHPLLRERPDRPPDPPQVPRRQPPLAEPIPDPVRPEESLARRGRPSVPRRQPPLAEPIPDPVRPEEFLARHAPHPTGDPPPVGRNRDRV